MSDSNEIKNDQKHPRLRLPQAGVEAQEAHDDGQPLTVEAFVASQWDLYLDVLNGRVDLSVALAANAIAGTMVKATAAGLKYSEMQLQYAELLDKISPAPLQLTAGRRKSVKKRPTA